MADAFEIFQEKWDAKYAMKVARAAAKSARKYNSDPMAHLHNEAARLFLLDEDRMADAMAAAVIAEMRNPWRLAYGTVVRWSVRFYRRWRYRLLPRKKPPEFPLNAIPEPPEPPDPPEGEGIEPTDDKPVADHGPDNVHQIRAA